MERETVAALAGSSTLAKPVDLGLSIGRLSRVDAMQQQHMALAREASLHQLLQQVRSALQRLADSSYGECLRCDEPIGYPRLRARPEATLCHECQSANGR